MKIREIIAEDSQVSEAIPGLSTLGKLASKPFIQKAANAASKVAPELVQAKADLNVLRKAFSHLGSNFMNLIAAIGIGAVLLKTYINIKKLTSQLNSGQLAPADYEAKLQAELGYAATQLLAAGLVKGVISIGGAALGTIPFLGWLGRIVSSTSSPIAKGFLVYLATPEGSKLFAQWFIGAVMEEGFQGTIIDAISSYTKKAYDALMMRGKEAEKNTLTAAPADASGDSASADVDSDFFDKLGKEKPASDVQEFDPATGTWLNKPKS